MGNSTETIENDSVPAESTEHSLSKQSLWILTAKTIGFVLSVLLPLLVVRHLSQESVGIYRQAFLVIVSATSIIPMGFSMSAYYFLNRNAEYRASTILNIVVFNFLAGGLAFAVLATNPGILTTLFRDGQMAALAPVIGLAIWLAIFSTFLETAALANKEAKLATGIIIFSQLSRAAVMGGAAVVFESAEAIVYAAVIHGAGQAVVLIVFLNARFPRFWRAFDRGFFKEHVRYALPFGFAALLYNAQADLHHYFVAHEFSTADYAVYAYGCFQLPLIWALYESITAVLLPRMSELQSQGRTSEMLAMTARGIHKLAFLYLPLFIFLLIVADVFVTTLFTSKFAGSIPIFRINLLLLPLYCLILDPLERSFKELGSFLTKVRIVVVGGLAASLYFGVQGLGLTGVISIVVFFVLIERSVSVWRVSRLLGFRKSDLKLFGDVGRVAVAAGISGGVLLLIYIGGASSLVQILTDVCRTILSHFGFRSGWDFVGGSISLAIFAVVYGAIYFGLAYRFNAVDREELARVRAALDPVLVRAQGIRVWLFGARAVSGAAD